MTHSRTWAWLGSRNLLRIWQISDNISETVQDRHSYIGRLTGNHMLPIEWHRSQGPWVTI